MPRVEGLDKWTFQQRLARVTENKPGRRNVIIPQWWFMSLRFLAGGRWIVRLLDVWILHNSQESKLCCMSHNRYTKNRIRRGKERNALYPNSKIYVCRINIKPSLT